MKVRRADGGAVLNRTAMERESCRADSTSHAGGEALRVIDGRPSVAGFHLFSAPGLPIPRAPG